jgi:uncharacterized protein YgbK (DUF1537 family)
VRAAALRSGKKVVVLDDDPTGTQTVHGVPVLTEWSVETLCDELANDLPAVYLLTNSRSLPLAEAQAVNAEAGRNLRLASERTGRRVAVVSRSDSTLRGHFPGETDALAAALGGGFDAVLLIPAFIAGGRLTIENVHYVADAERLVPAGETEFARDASFGYRASDLRHWVEEKTAGRVRADQVAAISLRTIRIGGPEQVVRELLTLENGAVCVVNAASESDLAVAVLGILAAEERGRRFLYRTAGSFVPLRAGIVPRKLLVAGELPLREPRGALIVVGSYVPQSSRQVCALLKLPGISSLEVYVDALLDECRRGGEIARVAGHVTEQLRRGMDVVIYTSRQLVTGDDPAASLAIGRRVSEGLVSIISSTAEQPRYILAKGGITASVTATLGLGVQRAMVLGQIRPGVPVWQLGEETRFPGLAYVVFPGNVGTPDTLADIVTELRAR